MFERTKKFAKEHPLAFTATLAVGFIAGAVVVNAVAGKQYTLLRDQAYALHNTMMDVGNLALESGVPQESVNAVFTQNGIPVIQL